MRPLHNENTRVKIPALVHFTRLGYEYISLKNYNGSIDKDTNIFVDVFRNAINRTNNTNLSVSEVENIIEEFKIILSADDLGREFYSLLISGYRGLKLIDFENVNGVGNDFHVVTELTYKNGNDEFRPDIVVLINGLPLAFVEVKKPNNKDGIQVEYSRINKRFRNEKFKRFVNITQLMTFSNNSEYDDNELVPLEGAFYATSSYKNIFFNRFREEDVSIYNQIEPINEQKEIQILRDTNLVSIKQTPEYLTNHYFNPVPSKISALL